LIQTTGGVGCCPRTSLQRTAFDEVQARGWGEKGGQDWGGLGPLGQRQTSAILRFAEHSRHEGAACNTSGDGGAAAQRWGTWRGKRTRSFGASGGADGTVHHTQHGALEGRAGQSTVANVATEAGQAMIMDGHDSYTVGEGSLLLDHRLRSDLEGSSSGLSTAGLDVALRRTFTASNGPPTTSRSGNRSRREGPGR